MNPSLSSHQPAARQARGCGLLLSALSLFASAPLAAQPASGNQSKLDALLAIEQRVQQEFPKPAESATQVHSNGYFEALDLQIVRYGSLRRDLPLMRTPDPALIVYWVTRAGEPRNGFNAQVVALVKSIPALASWTDELQRASAAMEAETVQAERISTGYFSLKDEENRALRRKLDLPGKRQALADVLRRMLSEAGELDPEQNETWKPIYRFLKANIDDSWDKARQDRQDKAAAAEGSRKTFFDATDTPELASYFARLEPIYHQLQSLRIAHLDNTLNPGQEPMACFSDENTRAYASALLALDRELVQTLDSPVAKKDPAPIHVLFGMYPLWDSLDRYHAYLQYGKRTYSLAALVDAARIVLMAESWEPRVFDTVTGASSGDFVVQRAGHAIDLLQQAMRSGSAEPLAAAVAVDADGDRVRPPYAWVLWQWLTAQDLDDMKLDGRMIEADETRWLLPAGSRIKTIANREDAQAAGAEELVVAVDPSSIWASADAATR